MRHDNAIITVTTSGVQFFQDKEHSRKWGHEYLQFSASVRPWMTIFTSAIYLASALAQLFNVATWCKFNGADYYNDLTLTEVVMDISKSWQRNFFQVLKASDIQRLLLREGFQWVSVQFMGVGIITKRIQRHIQFHAAVVQKGFSHLKFFATSAGVTRASKCVQSVLSFGPVVYKDALFPWISRTCSVTQQGWIQLIWDTGGLDNSGLGASRILSGGECQGLGHQVGFQVTVAGTGDENKDQSDRPLGGIEQNPNVLVVFLLPSGTRPPLLFLFPCL
jgi:hypothetical protein